MADLLRATTPRLVLEAASRILQSNDRPDDMRLTLLPVNTLTQGMKFRDDVPPWMQELAAFAGGYTVGCETARWDPQIPGAGSPIINLWTVLYDGADDFSVIDISPENIWGAVYSTKGEDGELVFEASDFHQWLQTRLNLHIAATPLIKDIASDDNDSRRIYESYISNRLHRNRENGRDCARGQAGILISSDDEALRTFCQGLPPAAEIIDFRGAESGDFADTAYLHGAWRCRRAGSMPLFAALPPSEPVSEQRPPPRSISQALGLAGTRTSRWWRRAVRG